MKVHTDIFAMTALVGFGIGGLAWLLTRHLATRSRLWRLTLCLLFAAAFTPTVCSLYGGSVLPAAFVAFFALPGNADAMSLGLGRGVLPLGVVTTFIFVAWSAVLRRRRDHAA